MTIRPEIVPPEDLSCEDECAKTVGQVEPRLRKPISTQVDSRLFAGIGFLTASHLFQTLFGNHNESGLINQPQASLRTTAPSLRSVRHSQYIRRISLRTLTRPHIHPCC